MKNLRLKDKVAIVTGASSGVGAVTARLFAKEGAKVVLFARTEEKLKKAEQEIKEAGGEVVSCSGDIKSVEDVERACKLAVDTYGSLDIVANIAGIMGLNNGVDAASYEEYQEIFDTNAMGAIRFFKEGLKYMLPAKKGTFVTVNSVNGIMGNGGSAYSTSKGAEYAASKQLAWEYHLEGIRSNIICPTGINTPMASYQDKLDPHVMQAVFAHTCQGSTLVEPEEVANVILFLASDESSGINGQTIIVDHGNYL